MRLTRWLGRWKWTIGTVAVFAGLLTALAAEGQWVTFSAGCALLGYLVFVGARLYMNDRDVLKLLFPGDKRPHGR